MKKIKKIMMCGVIGLCLTVAQGFADNSDQDSNSNIKQKLNKSTNYPDPQIKQNGNVQHPDFDWKSADKKADPKGFEPSSYKTDDKKKQGNSGMQVKPKGDGNPQGFEPSSMKPTGKKNAKDQNNQPKDSASSAGGGNS